MDRTFWPRCLFEKVLQSDLSVEWQQKSSDYWYRNSEMWTYIFWAQYSRAGWITFCLSDVTDGCSLEMISGRHAALIVMSCPRAELPRVGTVLNLMITPIKYRKRNKYFLTSCKQYLVIMYKSGQWQSFGKSECCETWVSLCLQTTVDWVSWERDGRYIQL